MLYAISALDVLFLRDPKPFETGEGHHARGVFPPSPVTLLGMLRAVLIEEQLRRHGLTFEELDADDGSNGAAMAIHARLGRGPNDLGQLRLRGPLLWNESGGDHAEAHLWFPMPLDVMRVEQTVSGRVMASNRVMRPSQTPLLRRPTNSNPNAPLEVPLSPLELEALPGAEAEPPPESLLPAFMLEQALCGETVSDPRSSVKLWDRETRTGIRIDRQLGTVEPGMLYSIEVARPRDNLRIVIDVVVGDPAETIKRDAWLARLGGAGHLVTLEALPPHHQASEAFEQLTRGSTLRDAVTRQAGRFKLYFMTPAIFKRGWLPDGVDDTGHIELAGRRCKLVSAAVGKPEYLGGWDLAARMPKPLQAAVPAGSVYLFEPVDAFNDEELGPFVDRLFNEHHLMPFTAPRPVGSNTTTGADTDWFSQAGFGLTLVGGWSYVL